MGRPAEKPDSSARPACLIRYNCSRQSHVRLDGACTSGGGRLKEDAMSRGISTRRIVWGVGVAILLLLWGVLCGSLAPDRGAAHPAHEPSAGHRPPPREQGRGAVVGADQRWSDAAGLVSADPGTSAIDRPGSWHVELMARDGRPGPRSPSRRLRRSALRPPWAWPERPVAADPGPAGTPRHPGGDELGRDAKGSPRIASAGSAIPWEPPRFSWRRPRTPEFRSR